MENAIEEKWERVQKFVKERFDENLDAQTILFVIGLQELGLGMRKYEKQEKLDIIHIGICTVLLPFGYYKFIGNDNEGWPHFKNIKKLPNRLKGEHQQNFIKEAIIKYFDL